MNEITQETLIRKYGKEKGEEAFAEIALIGGFGEVGPGESQLHADSVLDVRGVLDPENKAVHEATKKRIQQLLDGTAEPNMEKAEKKAKP